MTSKKSNVEKQREIFAISQKYSNKLDDLMRKREEIMANFLQILREKRLKEVRGAIDRL